MLDLDEPGVANVEDTTADLIASFQALTRREMAMLAGQLDDAGAY